MNKKAFIQQASTQFLPALEWDVNKAIKYGEKLWQRLSESGYGYDAQKPKEAPDNWYVKLQGESKLQFDSLWDAYKVKKGKHPAAKVWYELGDVPRDEAKKIIEAARSAARDRNPTQTPKFLQGWLSERRYDDYHQEVKKEIKTKDPKVGHLAHLKRMYKMNPTPEIKAQIDGIEDNH